MYEFPNWYIRQLFVISSKLAEPDRENAGGYEKHGDDDGGLEDNFFRAALGAIADPGAAERGRQARPALLE